MEHCDILIIGAGAAGIAAAKSAAEAGCENILLVDRKERMGGVLLQCAHHGFGLNLSGPEYTEKLLSGFPNRVRWQPNGALPIGGTRPKGIYTAGQMQEMMNLHGITPKGPVVILGSGDLGLVMARHLGERGIPVTLVERKPHCGGMVKNRSCLREFPIKLVCNATITEVLGSNQLEGVVVSDTMRIPCATLLIVPERELIFGLEQADWIHVCGNCRTVHPMVEAVVNEGKQAGIAAWEAIRGSL